MKRSVYIETSVVSYLTARPSPNALVASCQQITAEWWSRQHGKFELFTSELVNVEAGMGDPILAAARLQILTRLPVLRLTDPAVSLANVLIRKRALPDQAQADALHIAIATIHQIQYLATWDCRHINNPAIKPAIRTICRQEGFICPEFCTPLELREAGKL
jgi:predicted nucleic acid-binding protein